MRQQTHWEHVYQKKDAKDVSWFQPYPKVSMELIHNANLGKREAIIDVGGGASTLVDALLDAQYQSVSVLDISNEGLLQSQSRLGERAHQVTWLVDDVTTFEAPERYQLWHDRAVFHFMNTPESREQYMDVLKRSLAPGGHFVLATFAIGGPDKCSGLPAEQYDEAKIRQVLGEDFVLQSVRHDKHMTPSGGEQKFIYFHFMYEPVDKLKA